MWRSWEMPVLLSCPVFLLLHFGSLLGLLSERWYAPCPARALTWSFCWGSFRGTFVSLVYPAYDFPLICWCLPEHSSVVKLSWNWPENLGVTWMRTDRLCDCTSLLLHTLCLKMHHSPPPQKISLISLQRRYSNVPVCFICVSGFSNQSITVHRSIYIIHMLVFCSGLFFSAEQILLCYIECLENTRKVTEILNLELHHNSFLWDSQKTYSAKLDSISFPQITGKIIFTLLL